MTQYQHGQRLTVKLADLDLNDLNPRTITTDNFALLTQSLIDFPEMLAVRGVVAKPTSPGRFLALGGNMRTQAKTWLVQQSEDEKRRLIERALATRPYEVPDLSNFGNPETDFVEAREEYRARLDVLFYDDSLEITLAVGLTEGQELEFVVKDNTDFGKFDFDALANVAGEVPFANWGVEGMPAPPAPPSSVENSSPSSDDGNPGDGDSRPAKVLIIAFTDPDDVQTAEPAVIEALDALGLNGFTVRAIVRTDE